MFGFLGLGLLALVALLLAVVVGGNDDMVSLIGFLVVGGFFAILALVKYERDRLYREKFGDEEPKKRKRQLGAGLESIRLALAGRRWQWASGLIAGAVALAFIAMPGGPSRPLEGLAPVVAESAQPKAPGAPPVAVTAAEPTFKSAGPVAGKPLLIAAQVQVQDKLIAPINIQVNSPTTTPMSAQLKVAPVLTSVVQTSAAANDVELQVRSLIQAWGKAWSAGDADEYLASYSAAFVPANGTTRSQWEATRRLRVQEGRNISVSIEQLAINFDGSQQAKAVFTQDYRAKGLQETSTKTLSLRQVDGRWKITSEIDAPLVAGKKVW